MTTHRVPARQTGVYHRIGPAFGGCKSIMVPKIAGYPTWLVGHQPATLYIIVPYFIIFWSIEFTTDFDIRRVFHVMAVRQD